MAVGVVVEQPGSEPDDPLEAQILERPLLALCAGQRVAVGVQKALLGREHRARTVAVDRPALEYPLGLGEREGGAACQPLADIVVALQVIFATPAVEAEALRPPVLARSDHDRAGVAQPDVAERLDDDLGEGAQPARRLGGPLLRRDQPDFLALAASLERVREGCEPPLSG